MQRSFLIKQRKILQELNNSKIDSLDRNMKNKISKLRTQSSTIKKSEKEKGKHIQEIKIN